MAARDHKNKILQSTPSLITFMDSFKKPSRAFCITNGSVNDTQVVQNVLQKSRVASPEVEGREVEGRGREVEGRIFNLDKSR
ncbi:MAG: hypothetical protein WC799_19275 [Desulfobacteraceae bacterium]